MSAMTWRTLAVALGTICLISRTFAAGAEEDEFKNVREIRAVETYVPYDEFLKIAGKDPNATVMTLEEYRGLVELGRVVPVACQPPRQLEESSGP